MSGQAASYFNPQQSFAEGPQQPAGYPPQQGYPDQGGYAQYPQQLPPQQPPPQQYGYPPNPNIKPGYQPGYQQGPPPPPPPPQQPGKLEPPTYDQAVYGFDEAFKIEKPKYNDIWAGLLLIAVFLGYVAVSGVTIYRYSKNKNFSGGGIYDSANNISLDTNTIVLFIFVLCVAIGFSWLYYLGARYFPKTFIWVTGILNIVLAFATGIWYLTRKQYGAGIVFLIFGVFAVICFISWIPRIPFTAFMLRTAMDVAKGHFQVFLVSALGGIVTVAFAAWYSVTLVAIYTAYEPSSSSSSPGASSNPSCSDGGCSRARVIGLVVYVTFAMYWLSEWIKNTVHTTVAGIYGSWYFYTQDPDPSSSDVHQSAKTLPKGATRGAFTRATTYSFGSVSLGSLIIAFVNALRQACSMLYRHEAAEGSIVGSIFACILTSLIALLDWLVTLFNRYAFCHIALYGKAYIPAAKDTWKMMKDRGVDALVNDCLMGPVLTMGSVGVAYISALLAYLYLLFTKPEYNSEGNFTAVIMAFAFVIGLQVCQVFLTPVGSGIETFFVGVSWDPEVLWSAHPGVWQGMVKVYPKVQRTLRHD